jgi:predicted ATPase
VISRVQLRRFKRFQNEVIPVHVRGVSFVAGGNNSGKSTLLHAIAVWEFCRTVIEAEKGHQALLPGGMAQGIGLGDDEFSPVNVPSLRHLWTNLQHQKTPEDEDGYTLRIRCDWGEGNEHFLEFGLALANDRLFVKVTDSNLAADSPLPQVAYLPPFAGITDKETRTRGAIRRRRIGEGLAGAVLRNLLLDLSEANTTERVRLRSDRSKISDADLRKLRESDPWELLQQALRTVFGAELKLPPFREEYNSYIQASVIRGTLKGYKLQRHRTYRPRDLMVEGSGFLQWLSVYALAVSPDVTTLLLDEPDAHLHTSLQQQLVEELSALAERSGKQVLIATHSTEILRASNPSKILEVSSRRSARFLSKEEQKVALFAGLGADYAPRLDALRATKRLLLVEGKVDGDILRELARRIDRNWPDEWVLWTHKGGHKERKHLFLGLAEEIEGLVAVSLRDRDDENPNTVADDLTDQSHQAPPNFYPIKWRRRHIESYLAHPTAIAEASGADLDQVQERLREEFGVAIGESFVAVTPPDAIRDMHGKAILEAFGIEGRTAAGLLRPEFVPEDIKKFLDRLDLIDFLG